MAPGSERSFAPGTYEVTAAWIAVSIVLGLVYAIPALTGDRPDPGPRTQDTGILAATSNAANPVWTLLPNPTLGAVGVFLGTGLKRRDG
jgi:hypothetical protein